MKILIDISEDAYQEVLRRGLSLCPANEQSLVKAIKKGIQLPKGHGRLIDADEAKKVMVYEMFGTGYQSRAVRVLESIPTIIEAESEDKE